MRTQQVRPATLGLRKPVLGLSGRLFGKVQGNFLTETHPWKPARAATTAGAAETLENNWPVGLAEGFASQGAVLRAGGCPGRFG